MLARDADPFGGVLDIEPIPFWNRRLPSPSVDVDLPEARPPPHLGGDSDSPVVPRRRMAVAPAIAAPDDPLLLSPKMGQYCGNFFVHQKSVSAHQAANFFAALAGTRQLRASK